MTDYRNLIKERLAERCRANPRYSLRAFARDLGVSVSILSEVLSGKHGLSDKKAKKIVEKLGLNSEEQKMFLALVKASDARSRTDREAAKKILEKYSPDVLQPNQLTMDAFQVISDWHHFALIEYLQLPKKSHDPDDLAKALGFSTFVIREALDRLIRLEVIDRKEEHYKVLTPFYVSPHGVPSEALRKFHRQLLEKATQAIALQSLDQRELRSLVFAVNKKKIPEIKQAIQKFVRTQNEESMRDTDRDTVYCLAVQLFELTPGEKP